MFLSERLDQPSLQCIIIWTGSTDTFSVYYLSYTTTFFCSVFPPIRTTIEPSPTFLVGISRMPRHQKELKLGKDILRHSKVHGTQQAHIVGRLFGTYHFLARKFMRLTIPSASILFTIQTTSTGSPQHLSQMLGMLTCLCSAICIALVWVMSHFVAALTAEPTESSQYGHVRCWYAWDKSAAPPKFTSMRMFLAAPAAWRAWYLRFYLISIYLLICAIKGHYLLHGFAFKLLVELRRM